MKKLFLFLVFVVIAAVNFGQVISEFEYDSLSLSDQEMFSNYGNMHEYASQNAKEHDTILMIYKINNVPQSRNMVDDSTGSHPEFETQYMIVYQKDGKNLAYVTTEDPESTASNTGVSISAYMAGPGYRQGDDEFNVKPKKTSTQKSYTISSEW